MELRSDDPLAVRADQVIHAGEVAALETLLAEHPELATARIVGSKGESRTLLHTAADWPGYFANAPIVVRVLIGAGADPNAPVLGSWHGETPLHWAASSDDVDVAAALIEGGADLEARGASIAGGTPLDDAVGYGCWRVARLLVQRGAVVEKLWHAAALGMNAEVEAMLASSPPSATELNDAFWQACHGGQRRTAELLLARGADPTWVPRYAKKSSLAIAESMDTGRQALAGWLRDRLAR